MNISKTTHAGYSPMGAEFGEFALSLGKAFIVMAFVVALVETGLALWVKWQSSKKAPAVAEKTLVAGVDPVAVLNALKGVLDALKGLPGWIAIFLAGYGLLWLVAEKPGTCVAPAASCSQTAAQNSQRQAAPPPSASVPSNTGTNTQ